MNARFKITPESYKVLYNVYGAEEGFQQVADKAIGELAKETVDRVKKVIVGQSFGAQPLTRKWVKEKLANGLDPRILMATLEYFKSIKVQRKGPRSYAVMANMEKLRRLDQGTGGPHANPPRPHWGPTLSYMRQRTPEMFAKRVIALLKEGKK